MVNDVIINNRRINRWYWKETSGSKINTTNRLQRLWNLIEILMFL